MQDVVRFLAAGRRRLIWPAAAVVALVGIGLVALGGAVIGARGAPAGGFSATVVPGRSDQQAASPAATGTAAGDTAGAAPASGQAQLAAPGVSFAGGPCTAAPTVQFQGRGLAATGLAPIVPAGPDGPPTTLTVSVQEHGADAGTVIDAVQGRVAAVEAALQGSGATSVQLTSFTTYGSPQSRQFTAYASVAAQLDAGRLPAATKAVLQVASVSYFSTGVGIGGQPSDEEVRDAVAAAAAQARDMAISTALAAGVSLGSAQSIVTQPPVVCYGGGLPSRVIQVTVTYALR